MSYRKQEVDAVPFIAAMLALLDKATLYRVAEHAWLRIFQGTMLWMGGGFFVNTIVINA